MRYLMTHSLLYAWIYAMKENPFEDATSERDPMGEFNTRCNYVLRDATPRYAAQRRATPRNAALRRATPCCAVLRRAASRCLQVLKKCDTMQNVKSYIAERSSGF